MDEDLGAVCRIHFDIRAKHVPDVFHKNERSAKITLRCSCKDFG